MSFVWAEIVTKLQTSIKTNKKINGEQRGLLSNFYLFGLLLNILWEEIKNNGGIYRKTRTEAIFLSLHPLETKTEATPPGKLLHRQTSVNRPQWSWWKSCSIKCKRAYWNASIFILFWWLSQRITMFTLDFYFLFFFWSALWEKTFSLLKATQSLTYTVSSFSLSWS